LNFKDDHDNWVVAWAMTMDYYLGIMHHDDDGSWTIAYKKGNHEHDQKNYGNGLLVVLRPTRQV